MKKILILGLMVLSLAVPSVAQRLTVESFEERPTDLSASVNRRLDNNDVPCALVKVQLAARGALFEGNVMGDVAYEASEYRVYMTAGSKRLKVKMEGYLPLEVEFSDYGIVSLQSKVTYMLVVMELDGISTEPQRATADVRFDIRKVEQATIYLDGEEQHKTRMGGLYTLTKGYHDFEIKSHGHKDYYGTFCLTNDTTIHVSMRWREKYGEFLPASLYLSFAFLRDGEDDKNLSLCVGMGAYCLLPKWNGFGIYSELNFGTDKEIGLVWPIGVTYRIGNPDNDVDFQLYCGSAHIFDDRLNIVNVGLHVGMRLGPSDMGCLSVGGILSDGHFCPTIGCGLLIGALFDSLR